MRQQLLIILIVLAGALTPVAAQNCGGLPCGAIPWQIPEFPALSSPTPYPTSAITATPTATATPTNAPTNTPQPTASPTVDFASLGGGVGALEGMLTGTPQTIYNAQGTPVAVGTLASGYNTNAVMALSYIKALQGADFGVITPLIQFFVGALVFVLAIKLLEMSIPFIAILFGALRRVVQLVLDFIPL